MRVEAKRNKPWSHEDDAALREYYLANGPLAHPPHIAGHSPNAASRRATKLNLYLLKPRSGWLTSEVKVLRAEYPQTGAMGCMEKLPNRSAYAIYQQACKLKLKTGVTARGGNAEELVAAINREYRAHGRLGSSTVNNIVRELKVSPGRVKYQARKLNMLMERHNAKWTSAEDEILYANDNDLDAAMHALQADGYARSPMAIVRRCHAIGANLKNADCFSVADLAMAFGVPASVVYKWNARELLPKPSRYTKRGAVAWTTGELKRFLVQHITLWDQNRIDKYFLVGILNGTL